MFSGMSERRIEADDIGGRDQLVEADEGSVAGFRCGEGCRLWYWIFMPKAWARFATSDFLGEVGIGKNLQGRGTNMSYSTHSKDTEKLSAGIMAQGEFVAASPLS
jgi:hypothetical protein